MVDRSRSDAWAAAGIRARELLPDDRSSAEAAFLSRQAAALLQAVVFEFCLESLGLELAVERCCELLRTELTEPGGLLGTLQNSTSTQVGRVALATQKSGSTPISPFSQTRNLVVMMALVNLTSDRRSR